jgi:vitamin B12 transporter
MKRYTLLTTALIGAALPLGAQIDSLPQDLPEVTIRENRLELPFRETSRSINLITAAQIEQMPARSVNELLLYVAGVDVRQRGPHGVQADIGLRGGTFDQTLILVNGVKLNDPQTGHHNMNLPFDIENIERIEVLKGPGARIYGQNAFAGAINIVTKTPREAQVKAALRGGENELAGGTLALAMPQGDFSHYFSVAKDYSGGYRYNTDYDITSFFYQNTYEKGAHRVQLLAGHAEREFGANGFYASPAFQDQYEEVNTTFASLQYQQRGDGWQIMPRLSWRKNADDYVFVRNNPSLYQNIHLSHTLSGELHGSYASAWGQTGLGVELSRISLNSTNLGQHLRWASSFFLEHRFAWWEGRLDLTPGFSYNRYSDFGDRFFPGIDLGLRLSSAWKAFANVGYTYRVPTFTDLFYEDPANNGNPDLQPEEAIAYELGIKYQRPGIQIQAAVFQRDGYDLIDWTKAADTLRWTPININALTTRGLELNGQLYFPLLWPRAAWLERFQLGYSFLDNQLADNGAAFSRYALENLRHQFVAGLSYRPARRWLHSLYYRYTERVNLPRYQLVDTRLNYEPPGRFSAFLEISNLFDVRYRETNLVEMPGRWARAGVGWKWGG